MNLAKRTKRTKHRVVITAAMAGFLLLSLSACCSQRITSQSFADYEEMQRTLSDSGAENTTLPDTSRYEQREPEYFVEYEGKASVTGCTRESPNRYSVSIWHYAKEYGKEPRYLTINAVPMEPSEFSALPDPAISYREASLGVSTMLLPYDEERRATGGLEEEALEICGGIDLYLESYHYRIDGLVVLNPDEEGNAFAEKGETAFLPLSAREELLALVDSSLDQAGAPAATEEERTALLNSESWGAVIEEDDAVNASSAARVEAMEDAEKLRRAQQEREAEAKAEAARAREARIAEQEANPQPPKPEAAPAPPESE